jgi:imidazolonepropionase-like amidohydrolase
MLMMVRLSQEFGYKIGAMQHSLEAYKIAPELAKAGVGAGMFADHWGYKLEAYDAIPYNAAICWKAGVNVSINTDGLSGTTTLNIDAAKAMRFGGVPANEALKMLTINPAKQLGIDHRTGSIEVGKDADIGIWDGHPLSVYSKPWMTLVEGEVYFQRRDAFGIDGSSTIKHTLDRFVYKPEPALPKRAKAYAVRNATLYTVTDGVIENGTIVVQDGKITAIGRNVSIPSGATVIDGRGTTVYPGFIDAGTSIGLQEISGIAVMGRPNELGTHQPDLDAVTSLFIESAFLGTAAYNGMTMSLTKPSGGTVSGQAGFIRHYGLSTEQLGLQRKAALVVTFPNVSTFPNLDQLLEQMCCDATTWGELNLSYLDGLLPPPREYHEALHAQPGQGRQGGGLSQEQVNERVKEIEDYIAKAREYAANPPEVKDLRMEAMKPYINGEKPIVMQARSASTIRAAVDFAKRNKLRVVLTGAAEAWKEAELLARDRPLPGTRTTRAMWRPRSSRRRESSSRLRWATTRW